MPAARRVRRAVAGVGIASLVAAALTACSSAAPPSLVATPGPIATASPVAPTATPSGLPSQTDTAWGRIWDELPAGFPRLAGSTPTETGDGPASGRFAMPGSVAEAAAAMQASLEGAGFSTEAQSGPLEDGSVVVDSTGLDPGCRVETTIEPLGGLTIVTVLYGAACPFD